MKRKENPKSVFNPLSKDFKATYLGDNNLPTEYLIRSMEIETFPAYIADHMIKHLVDEVKNDREIGFATDEQIKKIREEIEVNEL